MKKLFVVLTTLLVMGCNSVDKGNEIDPRSRFQSGRDYREYINSPQKLSIEELEELRIDLSNYKDAMIRKYGEDKYSDMGDSYQVAQSFNNIDLLIKLRKEGK